MRWFWLGVVMLALGAAPQESKLLTWGLDAAEAADYKLFDTSRGKPRELSDESFILFGTDLDIEGGNRLITNNYRDLGIALLFRLPEKIPVTKATWTFQKQYFVKGRRALTAMLAFKPIEVQGILRVRKFEKVDGVDCVQVEGKYQYFEIRYDTQNVPKLQRKAMGKISTVQWLSLQKTLLVKGVFSINGKGQDFNGIKQGEAPRSASLNVGMQLVLKPERLKVDAIANLESVREAIRKGAAWLQTEQQSNGSFIDSGGSFARDFPVGSTALCVMALLHSGVKADDASVRSAFSFLRRKSLQKVYDVATMLMAYETLYLPMGAIKDLSSFREEDARKAIQKAITPQDRATMEKAAKWLISKQTRGGTWGYPENEVMMDHSNTQYAMLGLKSASRCGIRVPASTWQRAAEHWIEFQRTTGPKVTLQIEFFKNRDRGIEWKETEMEEDQGPWGYMTSALGEGGMSGALKVDDAGYGSMTCAGLTSLVIAQSELVQQKQVSKNLNKQIESSKRQGLAWLQYNYSVRGNRPAAGFWSLFYYYYLYSLERVGMLYGIEKIGGHDWYQEGAMLLVRSQKNNGQWEDFDKIPVIDTAFALLFLKKATLPVSTKTGSSKERK